MERKDIINIFQLSEGKSLFIFMYEWAAESISTMMLTLPYCSDVIITKQRGQSSQP